MRETGFCLLYTRKGRLFSQREEERKEKNMSEHVICLDRTVFMQKYCAQMRGMGAESLLHHK